MQDHDAITVDDVLARVSPDDLNRRAEEYFTRIDDWGEQLAKPFHSEAEVPELLGAAAALVAVMDLAPGMTILDFGAGTCWLSHMLSSLGCRVIASDVSETALRIGAERYTRHPPSRDVPAPEFLVFDGRRLTLDDESVDRVVCFDAFHHVPNPEEVLAELHRVLRAGGRAGFAEPGPGNSQTAQSQYEMKTFGVLERDVDLDEVWGWARAAGFDDLKAGAYLARPRMMDLGSYRALVDGRRAPARDVVEAVRAWHEYHTVYVLLKGADAPRDSRHPDGLAGELEVSVARDAAGSFVGRCSAVNRGSVSWLAEGVGRGSVRVGAHLYDTDGTLVDLDFLRVPLRSAGSASVAPGERVEVEFAVPHLPPGPHVLEFDLVSEGVAWFATLGSQPVRLEIP